MTTEFALRRGIVEPLGTVRVTRQARRKLWWRLVPLVLGPLLLLTQDIARSRPEGWLSMVFVGSGLVLVGIPAVLPWVLERGLSRARGWSPPSQLAIRRLQLDSGTPARVIGGITAVITGAIALQALLSSQAAHHGMSVVAAGGAPMAILNVDSEYGDQAVAAVRGVPGVSGQRRERSYSGWTETIPRVPVSITEIDCDSLRGMVAGPLVCTDGDVFQPNGGSRVLLGQSISVSGNDDASVQAGGWTVPIEPRGVDLSDRAYHHGEVQRLFATPGALRTGQFPEVPWSVSLSMDPDRPDIEEHLRNAVAPLSWHSVLSTSLRPVYASDQLTFATLRNALSLASLFTLLLAGVSLLVLALEQLRERREVLAAMAAFGVSRGTLARSLLWQNAIPVVIGVMVAVAAGLGLAALVFRAARAPFAPDWPNIGLFAGTAVVLVLLVTAVVLPALRGATRRDGPDRGDR